MLCSSQDVITLTYCKIPSFYARFYTKLADDALATPIFGLWGSSESRNKNSFAPAINSTFSKSSSIVSSHSYFSSYYDYWSLNSSFINYAIVSIVMPWSLSLYKSKLMSKFSFLTQVSSSKSHKCIENTSVSSKSKIIYYASNIVYLRFNTYSAERSGISLFM